MNLKDLLLPFPEEEIEWRIGQAGKKGNGQIWATCLAYVSARAIQSRLDEVCGPENWKPEYVFLPEGVVCKLSIKYGGEWVTKEDGAEQTDIEAFKGGISSAIKRAGAVWGIGRYLYKLDRTYANILNERTPGAYYAKLKEGTDYYWEPPALPKWALPEGHQAKGMPQIAPEQPTHGDGILGEGKPKAQPYQKKTPLKLDPERSKLQAEMIAVHRKFSTHDSTRLSSLTQELFQKSTPADLDKEELRKLIFHMNTVIAEAET